MTASTWTAPEIERHPRVIGDERTTLETSLDWQRQTLLWKCGGLTGEQLSSRAIPGSTLTLLGLVRHLAEVERVWFRMRFAGEDTGYLWFSEEDPENDFEGGSAASAEADFATFDVEVGAARATVAPRSLDEMFARPSGEKVNLRWLYLHVLMDYTRHNGHADVLRELIDGRKGD